MCGPQHTKIYQIIQIKNIKHVKINREELVMQTWDMSERNTFFKNENSAFQRKIMYSSCIIYFVFKQL